MLRKQSDEGGIKICRPLLLFAATLPSVLGLKGLFTTNRDTPEAQANQLEWARQQMALEVPDETLDGAAIGDREDFIKQYIASEKEKFGREVDQATAEKEVDAYLLKKATNAAAQTSGADLVTAGAVFVAAFGIGLFFANKASS